MLKIKFIRFGNCVLMQILEQGKEIERGSGDVFKASNGITIKSSHYIELDSSVIGIMGKEPQDDSYVTAAEFDSQKQASEYIKRCTEAIKEYNEQARKWALDEDESKYSGIDVIIAE